MAFQTMFFFLKTNEEFLTLQDLKQLREDVSIHRTNLKYSGKSPKIRFHSYFHIL